jgi:hypothetical protein
MLIVIGAMALVGAVVTAIVLWPLGVLIALAGPRGGGSNVGVSSSETSLGTNPEPESKPPYHQAGS